MHWTADRLGITIRDNGQGLDVARDGKSGHFGLEIMKERAAEMGGVLNVDSLPGEGTVVSLSVPMSRVLEPDTESTV